MPAAPGLFLRILPSFSSLIYNCSLLICSSSKEFSTLTKVVSRFSNRLRLFHLLSSTAAFGMTNRFILESLYFFYDECFSDSSYIRDSRVYERWFSAVEGW